MCFNYFWAHSQQLPQVIDWFGLIQRIKQSPFRQNEAHPQVGKKRQN